MEWPSFSQECCIYPVSRITPSGQGTEEPWSVSFLFRLSIKSCDKDYYCVLSVSDVPDV